MGDIRQPLLAGWAICHCFGVICRKTRGDNAIGPADDALVESCRKERVQSTTGHSSARKAQDPKIIIEPIGTTASGRHPQPRCREPDSEKRMLSDDRASDLTTLNPTVCRALILRCLATRNLEPQPSVLTRALGSGSCRNARLCRFVAEVAANCLTARIGGLIPFDARAKRAV
jgi:hypothetical protein